MLFDGLQLVQGRPGHLTHKLVVGVSESGRNRIREVRNPNLELRKVTVEDDLGAVQADLDEISNLQALEWSGVERRAARERRVVQDRLNIGNEVRTCGVVPRGANTVDGEYIAGSVGVESDLCAARNSGKACSTGEVNRREVRKSLCRGARRINVGDQGSDVRVSVGGGLRDS